MPRILLSADHVTPLVLEAIGAEYIQPLLAAAYPPLPQPFRTTPERIEGLQDTNFAAIVEDYRSGCAESAKKPFCNISRVGLKV